MTTPKDPLNKKKKIYPKSLRKTKKQFDSYVKYSTLTIEMGLIIFLGVFGGMKLDKHLDLTFPVFTLLLSVVSFTFSIYLVIKDFLKK